MSNLQDIESRYLELIHEINKHNKNYYVNDNPTIDDFQYDQMFKELKDIESSNPELKREDSPTNRVGHEIISNFIKVSHNIPMLSLDNTYDMEDLRNFDKKIKKELTSKDLYTYIVEMKIDGLAVSLHYKNGVFDKAITRGDGKVGEDITHNVKKIYSVPLKLNTTSYNIPENFEVRGEIYMTYKELERINKIQEKNGDELYLNPRNLASGTMRRKDSSKSSQYKVNAFIYQIVNKIDGLETQEDSLNLLSKLGFSVEPNFEKINDIKDIEKIIEDKKDYKSTLDYATDGLVIKINEFKYRDIIGGTSHHPNWAIAYKFPATKVYTKLLDVSYSVGKTGVITPVAELQPTLIDGTTVKRASLHNFDIIKNLGIKIGDSVLIEKAAEIIPQVIGYDKDSRNKDVVKEIKIPTKCPSCNNNVIFESPFVKCINLSCPDQIKGKIEYWVSKSAMNIIGFGESLINQLVDNNIIETIADIYDLTEDELSSLERMGEKSAKNIIQSINKSKSNPFNNVLCGLSISGVGRTLSESICNRFKDIDELMNASYEELIEIEDVGDIIANNIIAFFKNVDNIRVIKLLKLHGLNLENKEDEINHPVDLKSNLKDMIFCVTGKLINYTRDDIHNMIKKNGGKTSSSISKKVNYLICGADAGSKLEKAKSLNIDILTEDEFLELVK